MKKLSRLVLSVAYALVALMPFAQCLAQVDDRSYLASNLDFEYGALGQAPPNWLCSGFSNGSNPYEIVLSADHPEHGRLCGLLCTVRPVNQGFGNLSQQIDATPYRGKEISYSAYVRVQPPSPSGSAGLWLRVDRPGGRMGFFDNMADRPITSGVWRRYTITGDVSPDAQQITFGLMLNGGGKAWIDNASLVVLGNANLATTQRAHVGPLDGPGVLDVAVQMPVRAIVPGRTGVVTFPVPGVYPDQAPLCLRITTVPPSALKSYHWRRRADGMNWLIDVVVAPPKRGAIVRWRALVLVNERSVPALPLAARPECPPAARTWTRPTACVQSGDPAIVAKAMELAQGTHDVETYVRRVIDFTAMNQGKPGVKFDSLDARKGLECGGSCTDRANLAAALLRARGIPARTVAHMPAWTNGEKGYEHWLVEYWHPRVGWVWIEPTLDEFEPSPTTAAVLAVSSPDDENKAFDPIHLRGVMPGAPYLSVCELSRELEMADLLGDTDAFNLATPVARVRGNGDQMARLMSAARESFTVMVRGVQPEDKKSWDAILAAAKTGKAETLTRCIKSL